MWKCAVFAVIAMLAGFFLGSRWNSPMTAADHWRVVTEFKAALSDPAKIKSDGRFQFIDVPASYDSSLASLVAAGELHLVEIVLPSVPKTPEATKFWIQRSKNYPEIIEMQGNPEWVDYKPAGIQPLFLKCWVREKDLESVWKLCREIEAEFGAK